jgi:hypothetical protein
LGSTGKSLLRNNHKLVLLQIPHDVIKQNHKILPLVSFSSTWTTLLFALSVL